MDFLGISKKPLFNRLIDNKIFWNVSLFLCAVTLLYSLIYALKRGLLFSDESYYLLNISNHSQSMGMTWYRKYAFFLKDVSIFNIRLFTVCSFIFSGMLFLTGFLSYSKTKFKLEYVFLIIISLFTFTSPVQFVPNYITINLIVIYSSFGLLLLGISLKNRLLKSINLFICGVLIGQLPFIMLPNVLLLFLIIFYLFIIKDNIIVHLSSIIVGFIFGILLFFKFLFPFSEFYIEFTSTLEYLKFDKTHGIKNMIVWSISTVLYFIKSVLPIAIVLFIFIAKDFVFNRSIKNIIGLSLILFLLCNIYNDHIMNYTQLSDPSVNFALFLGLTLWLFSLYKGKSDLFWLGLVLFFIPIFASLGTDVKFEYRSALYMMPISFYIYFVLSENKLIFIKFFYLLFIILSVLRFSVEFIHRPGWAGYVISDQKSSILNINSKVDILLDERTSKELNIIKDIVPPHSDVYISSCYAFGYVYILKLNTPLLYYNYNDDVMNALFSKQPNLLKNEIYLIEDEIIPFPENNYFNRAFNNNNLVYQNDRFTITKYTNTPTKDNVN